MLNFFSKFKKNKKCEEFISLLKSKKSYEEYYNFVENWELVENYYDQSGDYFSLCYAGYCDNHITLNKKTNNFELIHYTYPRDPITGEYDGSVYFVEKEFKTTQEVWEKVIKPDIEAYLDRKIDE